jgi:Tfp pilus assembly protein PilX
MGKRKRGVALLFTLLVAVVLAVLMASFFSRTINENNMVKRHIYSTRAFWLAEAGVAEAINRLPAMSVLPNCSTRGTLDGDGFTYTACVSRLKSQYYQIDSTGSVIWSAGAGISRSIRAIVTTHPLSAGNFSNALATTGKLITNGNAYTINGTVQQNASLDFASLFGYSKEEIRSYAESIYGHLYTTIGSSTVISGISWVDVPDGTELAVTGNFAGSGLLIIKGDVHIAGTTDFDGIIYVIGKLRMSGTPVVNGAILAESDANINTTVSGHVTINYDQDEIAEALAALELVSATVVSWQEL